MADENKITVQEFVSNLNKYKYDSDKDNYMKSLIRRTYVSYETKSYLVKKIIETCYVLKDENKKPNGKICVDSNMEYVMFVLTMVSQYTYIFMNPDKITDDIDLLEQDNLVDYIFGFIPLEERNRFKTMLANAEKDFMTNNCEIHNYISNQVDKLGEAIKDLGKAMMPVLKEALKDMGRDDISTLIDLLKKFVK